MSIIVFIILSINEVIADVNVALRKTVTYCGGEHNYASVTDGDRTVTNVESIYIICESYSYMEINLERVFYIHYVIVYEGKLDGSTSLAYFVVYVNEQVCSHYPKTRTGPNLDKGMRVNCKVHSRSNKVRVQSRYNIGLSIAEIEAYTIVTDFDGKAIIIHIGCYKTFAVDEMEAQNLIHCVQMCQINNYHFASFKPSETCFCGNIIHEIDRTSLARCDIKCGNNYCGGENVFSIYLTQIELTYLESCYSGPLTTTSHGQMSISQCARDCGSNIYAALNGGQNCSCINSLNDLVITSASHCDLPCNTNPDEICGGINYFSVYKIQRMKFLFHCEFDMDQYDVCKNGCHPYYIGDYCLENIIQYCYSFNPCATKPNMICVESFTENYQCECMDGYIKDSNKSCIAIVKSTEIVTTTDIEEDTNSTSTIGVTTINTEKEKESTSTFRAISDTMTITVTDSSTLIETTINICEHNDPCAHKSNTECITFNSGTYRCECKEGFTELSGICEDVDECEFVPCESKNSKCFNTQGAYRCDCLESFVQVTEFVCINNATSSWDSKTDFNVFYLFVSTMALFIILAVGMALLLKQCRELSKSSLSTLSTLSSSAD